MSALITLPRMGETMESGRVAAWLKKPGDSFERGETIAEIETDKVTVEMPALDAGRLTEILVPEGHEVAVGEPLGRYDATAGGEDLPQAKPVVEPAPRPVVAAAIAQAENQLADVPTRPPQKGAARPAQADGRQRATPLARRLARQAGLDITALTGSGRRNRIEKQDVELALNGRAPAEALASTLPEIRFVDLPLGRVAYRDWMPASAVRRTILLLHGFSAEAATWAPVAAGLTRAGTRVIGPDLPGHGATPIEAATFEEVCVAATLFAETMGLSGAPVFGHSMGGAVAIRLAATGQLRPASLTLIAPAGLGASIDGDFVQGMATVKTAGALAHLLRRLARRAPTLSRPQLEAMVQQVAQGRLQALAADLAPDGRQGVDIVADLAAVAVPTRLIWGVEDRIIPWQQVSAAPPRTAIHLIADAGHMPHWDRPQDLAALLA